MNLKGLFLTALITFSATNTIQADDLKQQEKIQQVTDQPQWQDLWNTYGGVIIPAILIGYTTGKLGVIMNTQVSLFNIKEDHPITALASYITILIGECILRQILVNEFNKTLEVHSIKGKRDQIQKIAFATAIMTFLHPPIFLH